MKPTYKPTPKVVSTLYPRRESPQQVIEEAQSLLPITNINQLRFFMQLYANTLIECGVEQLNKESP